VLLCTVLACVQRQGRGHEAADGEMFLLQQQPERQM
jgi:hypothetical protein